VKPPLENQIFFLIDILGERLIFGLCHNCHDLKQLAINKMLSGETSTFGR
jgi:hypothetical protein